MLNRDKEATAETGRPHEEEEAEMEIKDFGRTQGHVVSPLKQSAGLPGEEPQVSHTIEADVARDARHGDQGVQDVHRDSQNDVDDTRQSNATPLNEPSPSDDVSLNLGGGANEEDMAMDIRRQDDTGVEERRVAFLPPPRVSPVFVPPRSSYPVGPPPIGSAYGSPPIGQIGVHYPREIVRIERDYSGGDLIQFYPVYPIELEGRITPTQWLDTVNGINEILISAHSLKRAALDHVLSVFTLYISSLIFNTHYDKEMRRLRTFIEQCNEQLYHSQGLNILWPMPSGFLFLEIEYY